VKTQVEPHAEMVQRMAACASCGSPTSADSLVCAACEIVALDDAGSNERAEIDLVARHAADGGDQCVLEDEWNPAALDAAWPWPLDPQDEGAIGESSHEVVAGGSAPSAAPHDPAVPSGGAAADLEPCTIGAKRDVSDDHHRSSDESSAPRESGEGLIEPAAPPRAGVQLESWWVPSLAGAFASGEPHAMTRMRQDDPEADGEPGADQRDYGTADACGLVVLDGAATFPVVEGRDGTQHAARLESWWVPQAGSSRGSSYAATAAALAAAVVVESRRPELAIVRASAEDAPDAASASTGDASAEQRHTDSESGRESPPPALRLVVATPGPTARDASADTATEPGPDPALPALAIVPPSERTLEPDDQHEHEGRCEASATTVEEALWPNAGEDSSTVGALPQPWWSSPEAVVRQEETPSGVANPPTCDAKPEAPLTASQPTATPRTAPAAEALRPLPRVRAMPVKVAGPVTRPVSGALSHSSTRPAFLIAAVVAILIGGAFAVFGWTSSTTARPSTARPVVPRPATLPSTPVNVGAGVPGAIDAKLDLPPATPDPVVPSASAMRPTGGRAKDIATRDRRMKAGAAPVGSRGKAAHRSQRGATSARRSVTTANR
jgi:hypothetical protein